MKEMLNLKDFMADSYSVGEWDGKEDLAARNVNRIYQAIYDAAPEDMDADRLAQTLQRVWDDWGSGPELLELSEDEIDEYVGRVL